MLKMLSIIIFLYAIACLFLYIMQRSILYFPTPEIMKMNAEAMWLQTSQEKLKVWTINKNRPAVIYFGGNSEQIEDNIADFKTMFGQHSIYVVNYRGFGGSSGKPTEQGLFADALEVYDQLSSQHSSISVIGRSLGSGVASYLAAHRPVEKLVLITPYDSISNVAQSHYPIFPVRWLIKDRFDSVSYASSMNSKTLVLYAENDLVVPMKHTTRLLNYLPDAQSHMIKGTAHNDISSNHQYQKLLAEFINS